MLSLRPEHLKRYKDIAALFVKYGRSDLVKKFGIKIDLPVLQSRIPPQQLADELSRDLQRLGPTFIKIGQLLSTQTDLLPVPYEEALSHLQDDIEPFPYEDVQEILLAELGKRPETAFKTFDPEPVAAASLGQVHKATLFDGKVVAVKVQRPHIRQIIVNDMEILQEIAHAIDRSTLLGQRYDLTGKALDFKQSLFDELDYNRERKSLESIGYNLKNFERILVPQPISDYCTARVLTMEYINGHRITELSSEQKSTIDGPGLAEEIFQAYLRQILIDGFVHLDPHPGNIYVTDDLQKLLLLDLGMTGRLSPRLQNDLVKLLLCVSDNRGEDAADIALRLGYQTQQVNIQAFRHEVAALVSRYAEATLEELSVGQLVLKISRVSQSYGNQLPQQFIMLAKTLIKLDRVGKALDPSFNPNASIRDNATKLLGKRFSRNITKNQTYQYVLEVAQLLQSLPFKLNTMLDLVSQNEIQLKVDAIDETVLLDGFKKIANRITVGLILAALIIGAAILMNVETSITILGYPAFAIFFFLGAAVGGVLLIISILYSAR